MKPIIEAGKLDKVITVQRATTSKSDSGGEIETWADLMTVRAQLVENSATEHLRTSGTESERLAVFKIWFRDVGLFDRVLFEGKTFDIIELVELGRKQGLEIRCKAVGS